MKMAWLRLDFLFMPVAAVARISDPCSSTVAIASMLSTCGQSCMTHESRQRITGAVCVSPVHVPIRLCWERMAYHDLRRPDATAATAREAACCSLEMQAAAVPTRLFVGGARQAHAAALHLANGNHRLRRRVGDEQVPDVLVQNLHKPDAHRAERVRLPFTLKLALQVELSMPTAISRLLIFLTTQPQPPSQSGSRTHHAEQARAGKAYELTWRTSSKRVAMTLGMTPWFAAPAPKAEPMVYVLPEPVWPVSTL